MAERASISRVVGLLVDVLEESGEIYAFGGALALAAWSEPRATADVDLVIWVDDDRLDVAFDLLRKAGARLDPEQARAEARDRGMFVCHVEGVRVDVFVPSIPFYAAARSRRVRTAMAGRDTWVHRSRSAVGFLNTSTTAGPLALPWTGELYICTATYIGKGHVLTAAHCCLGDQTSPAASI